MDSGLLKPKNWLQTLIGTIFSIVCFIYVILNFFSLFVIYEYPISQALFNPSTWGLLVIGITSVLSAIIGNRFLKFCQFIAVVIGALLSLFQNLTAYTVDSLSTLPGDSILLIVSIVIIGIAYKYYDKHSVIKSIISLLIILITIYVPYYNQTPSNMITGLSFILYSIIGTIILYFAFLQIKSNIIEEYKKQHNKKYNFKRLENMLEKHLTTEERLVNVNNKLFNKNNELRDENTLLKTLIVKQYYSEKAM